MLLVKYTKDNTLKIFALKQMKKVHILETMQQEHVFNERRIMLSCEYLLYVLCLYVKFLPAIVFLCGLKEKQES